MARNNRPSRAVKKPVQSEKFQNDFEDDDDASVMFNNAHLLNKKYGSCLVAIDPKRVRRPEFNSRATDSNHESIERWKNVFINGGYGAGNRFVSVYIAHVPPNVQNILTQFLNSQRMVNLHELPRSCPQAVRKIINTNGVFFADGFHRAVALCDDGVVKAMRKTNGQVGAYLYFRRDGIPMREHDAVFIGSTLNGQESFYISMSLGDRCHCATDTLLSLLTIPTKEWPQSDSKSYAPSLQDLHTRKHSLSVHSFKRLMEEHNINPDITHRKQRSRYNALHRGVFRYSTTSARARLLERAVDEGSLNLWTFSSVWDTKSFSEQLFVLHALPRLFRQSATAQKISTTNDVAASSSESTTLNSRNITSATRVVSMLWDCICSTILDVLKIRHDECFSHVVYNSRMKDSQRTSMSYKAIDLLVSKPTNVLATINASERLTLVTSIVVDLKGYLMPPDIMKFFRILQQTEGNAARNEDKEKNAADIVSQETCSESDDSEDITNFSAKKKNREQYDDDSHPRESMAQSCTMKAPVVQACSNNKRQKLLTLTETFRTHSPPPPNRSRTPSANVFVPKDPLSDSVAAALININKVCTDWTPSFETRVLLPTSDEEGFCVTHRDGDVISWRLPEVRDFGFDGVREEGEHLEENRAQNFGRWYEGYVNVAGVGRQLFRLYDDRERTYTRLAKDFTLESSLTARSDDYFVPALTLMPTKHADTQQMRAHEPSIQNILRVLGFRPPNRVFFSGITMDDYVSLRRCFFHGIVSANPGHFRALRTMFELDGNHSHPEVLDVVKESMSNYFESLRSQLDTAGFVVLGQVFAPFRFTRDSGWSSRLDLEDCCDIGEEFEYFMNYWAEKTPSRDEIIAQALTPEHFQLWTSIRDEQNLEGINRDSRLQTSTFAMTTHLETNCDEERKLKVLRTRCKLDILIMQAAASLRLQFSTWRHSYNTSEARHHHFKRHAVLAPDTSGRIIQNISRYVKPQRGHLDFIFNENEQRCSNTRAVKYPPYFVMLAGHQGHPLWICEGSHRLESVTEEEMKFIGKKINLDLFCVLPWSLIIIRGDVYHGGACGSDTGGRLCARYHTFLIRKGVAIGDVVNDFVGKRVKRNTRDCNNHQGRIRLK